MFSLLRRRPPERRSPTATRDRPDVSKPRNRYVRSPQTHLPDHLLQTQESLHTASQTSSQTHLPDLLQTQESLHTASKTNLPDLPRPSPRPTSSNLLQNPGIVTYGLPDPPQTSKPRNRYRTHLPDLPRPPPNLGIATYGLQTQDSQYSLDIHNTTQHDYPTRHSTTTRHPKRPSHDAKPKQYWDTSLG